MIMYLYKAVSIHRHPLTRYTILHTFSRSAQAQAQHTVIQSMLQLQTAYNHLIVFISYSISNYSNPFNLNKTNDVYISSYCLSYAWYLFIYSLTFWFLSFLECSVLNFFEDKTQDAEQMNDKTRIGIQSSFLYLSFFWLHTGGCMVYVCSIMELLASPTTANTAEHTKPSVS